MANIASQEKRILRSERERIENRRYTSAIRTYFRRLQTAVGDGDDDTADAEHRQLTALIDKAVKRGALHRNTGARKKSRAARLRRGGEEPVAAKATAAKSTKAASGKAAAAKSTSGKASAAKSTPGKAKASSGKAKAAEKASADKSE